MTAPPRSLTDVQDEFLATLARRELAATTRLLRLYAPVYRDLVKQAESLTQELADAQAQGRDFTALSAKNQRIVALRDQIARRIDTFAREAEVSARELQSIGVDLAQSHSATLMQAALAGSAPGYQTSFARLPAQALDNLVGQFADGSPLRDLFQTFGPDAAHDAEQILFRTLATGQHPRIAARQLQTRLGVPLTRAMTLARTTMLDSYRESSRRTYQANSDIVMGWRWTAHIGPRTCGSCLAQHGTVHPLEERMASHTNCFPAGTLVSGPRAIGSSERWYEGQIVEVLTASGKRLTVTPNHPILTTQGWVAAGHLEVGGYLLSSRDAQAALGQVPDEYQVPALIEDVARAFGQQGSMATISVETAAKDFHGDGEGSQVHVVRSDSLLGNHLYAQRSKPGGKLDLSRRCVQRADLSRLSTLHQFGHGDDPSADSIVRSGSYSASLLRRSVSGSDTICLRLVTQRDPVCDQPHSHGTPRDAEYCCQRVFGLAPGVASGQFLLGERELGAACGVDLLADDCLPGFGVTEQTACLQDFSETLLSYSIPTRAGLRRFAGDVVADRILKVDVRRFSGQVFNLETTEGWYVADGVIVHNCRCSAVPVTRSWGDLGFPPEVEALAPPELATQRPGPELFERFTEADQRRVLGPRKYALWQSGQIDLVDLVQPTSHPRWGAGTQEASVAAALANHHQPKPWQRYDPPPTPPRIPAVRPDPEGAVAAARRILRRGPGWSYRDVALRVAQRFGVLLSLTEVRGLWNQLRRSA